MVTPASDPATGPARSHGGEERGARARALDDVSADGADEVASDLAALRRRLDDVSAQQRKTHATTHQLAESIAALVAAQRQRMRWLNLNSFVAYVIFTVLLGTAFYTLYARRAAALVAEGKAQVEARHAAERSAEKATAELSAMRATSARALAAYELYEKGQAQEAAAAHAALAGALTPLEEAALAAARDRAGRQAFDAAFEQGVVAARGASHTAAVEAFGRAVAVATAAAGQVPTTRVAQARYQLGAAHARAGQWQEARSALEAALSDGVEAPEARYQLAMVLDRLGELPRARIEYEKFATAHPKLFLAVVAMRRAAVLARWGKAAPPLPPLGAAAPGAAPLRPGLVRPAGRVPGAPAVPPPGAAPAPAPAPAADIAAPPAAPPPADAP